MRSSGVFVTLGSFVILTATQLSVFADTLTFRQGDGGAYSETQGASVSPFLGGGTGTETILHAHTVVDIPVEIAFLSFPDIIGSNPGQIPPGSTIDYATLDLVRVNDSVNVAYLSLVSGAWDENTINGSNYPGTSGSAGSIAAGGAGIHGIANVKGAVQAWASGTENWGLEISVAYSQNSIEERFYSDDSLTQDYRPLLTVTFTPPPNAVAHTTWGEIKALYQ